MLVKNGKASQATYTEWFRDDVYQKSVTGRGLHILSYYHARLKKKIKKILLNGIYETN